MPRTGVTAPSATERRFRALLAEHAVSGTTLNAFAARSGVRAGTLAWWKHEIARRERERLKAQPVALVPVTVVRAGRPEPAASPEAYAVRLRSGRVLRVPQGFNAAELRALVEVLEC